MRISDWSSDVCSSDLLGLECHAGHGLTFDTVGPVAVIPTIAELNIGHFLIGEAIFSGLDSAIRRMRALMNKERAQAGGARSARRRTSVRQGRRGVDRGNFGGRRAIKKKQKMRP